MRERAEGSRRTSRAEIDAVLRLDGPARFAHFVKRVADEERAWGLWREGWALVADGQSDVFPLWPAPEYAERCRSGDWEGHEAEEIALGDLLDELLPKLAARGIRPGVFPTPDGKGVVTTVEDLSRALRAELERYD
jgi:hypothetical protein